MKVFARVWLRVEVVEKILLMEVGRKLLFAELLCEGCMWRFRCRSCCVDCYGEFVVSRLLLKKCCCEVVVESLLSYGCCMKVIV